MGDERDERGPTAGGLAGLFPTPRVVRREAGVWRPTGSALQVAGDTDTDAALDQIQRLGISVERVVQVERADLRFRSIPVRSSPDGYSLRITRDGALVHAATRAGFYYAACTLGQLLVDPQTLEPRDRLSCCTIEDSPDFERRGVMLDVSRDRVPRMETLYTLIDQLARWKVNELQLYMEHTFAYSGHELVWSDASPFTAAEIRELDRFCRERCVDLVPNQQSLGHFHRWLRLERYRQLAECPDGVEHPFHTEPEPFSLAPTNPASIELVRDLYAQLLPAFSSRFLNVGLDETFDIGQGASRAAVAAKGKGRVYLDYLHEVRRAAAEHGRRIQFWGDVILEHPELVAELAKDAIALEWGYGAEHPFGEHTRRFADSGLDFYVCPGTSSWLSLGGRLGNALANIANAAAHGRQSGARGLLVTDWGDFGHWQPLPVSYAPLAQAAALAWNTAVAPADLAGLLDAQVFRDAAARTARTWIELGQVDEQCGAETENGTALFFLLRFAHESWPHPRIGGLRREGLERAAVRVEEIRRDIDTGGMLAPDAELVGREAHFVCDALAFACELGKVRLALGPGAPLSDVNTAGKRALRESWSHVRSTHAELWPTRSRPGGLADSLGRFAFLDALLA